MSTLALIGAQEFLKVEDHSINGFTRSFNQCRNSPSLSDIEGIDTWEGLQFQGVVADQATCAERCQENADCNAFEFYFEKKECSLAIGSMWKGIDINASDVGCFLKNKQIEDTCPKGETPCEEKGTHQCCYKGESCVPKVGCVCSGIDCFFRNNRYIWSYFF